MRLSVVICTRNRAQELTPCLKAVTTALANTDEPTELIVVDNGSSDETGVILKEFAAMHKGMRSIHEPCKGLSHARNTGMRAAAGTWIAFTDDDCRPAPDYYQQLLKMITENPVPALIGGRVELADPTDQPYCILTRNVPDIWQRESAPADGRNLATALIGANMVMHRDLVRQIGEFDVRYGAGGIFGGGEEIDYVYRTYLAGLPVIYNPDLVIYHAHGRKTLASVRELADGYDLGDGALYAKYLLRAPILLRPLVWDLKKALREPFGGPLCRPELGTSHWRRLYRVARGMLSYALYNWSR